MRNKIMTDEIEKKPAWIIWTIEIRKFAVNFLKLINTYNFTSEEEKDKIMGWGEKVRRIISDFENIFLHLDQEWTKEEEEEVRKYAKKLEMINKIISQFHPIEH